MVATLQIDTLKNASSATPNITLDTAGNATVGNTLAMGSSFLRNRVINGAMQIWQRGTSYSATPSAAPTYGSADRWAFYSLSPITASQSSSAPTGFQYSLKLQRPASATTTNLLLVEQVVETANMYDLAGQTVTLSFYAKAGANFSASGNLINVGINTGTVADQGSATSLGSWTGTASPLATTQAITTTWTRYSYNVAIGSTAQELAFFVYFTPTGTAGADDSIYITGVQLEVGSVATPFERRQYGQELALCQRYLPAFNSASTVFGIGPGYTGSTTSAVINCPYVVTSRVSPTGITVSNASHITFTSSAGSFVFSAASFGSASSTAIGFISGTISGATAGQGGAAYFNSTSGQLLFTGCEL